MYMQVDISQIPSVRAFAFARWSWRQGSVG